MFKHSIPLLLILISLSACSSKVAQLDIEECPGSQCYAMIELPTPLKKTIEEWEGI